MKRLMLLSAVLHTDETPVTVQDPKGKAKPHTGRVCRTRSRNKAQTLTAFRNLAITLIRQGKFECAPEGLEYYAENREDAIGTVIRRRTE